MFIFLGSVNQLNGKKENHLVPSLETFDTFLFVSFLCPTQEKKKFFDSQGSNNEL